MAAFFVGLFYAGITLVRFLSGILIFRLSGRQSIRLGLALILCAQRVNRAVKTRRDAL